ncbi:YcxB family protein [Prosthecodimorpha hirschii]|uniref:YcxB family protein n=1 Tax=Prosthecodimorpha hirschii TaxID=665126 RepID=UPI00112C53DE|nr:YcxB family protein [Prosthecomicrobium hirschii]
MSAKTSYEISFQLDVPYFEELCRLERGHFGLAVLRHFMTSAAVCIPTVIVLFYILSEFDLTKTFKVLSFFSSKYLLFSVSALIVFAVSAEAYIRIVLPSRLLKRVRADRIEQKILLTEDRVFNSSPVTEWSAKWSVVTKCIYSSEYITVMLDKLMYVVIPRSAVASPDEWAAITKFIQEKTHAAA